MIFSILAFLIGLGGLFSFRFVGVLNGTDILLVAFSWMGLSYFMKESQTHSYVGWILLYQIGIFLADVWNGGDWGNFLRSIAGNFVLICGFLCFLRLFSENPNNLFFYLLGMFFAYFYTFKYGSWNESVFLIEANLNTEQDRYLAMKYGTWIILGLNMLLIWFRLSWKRVFIIIFIAMTILCMYMGNRYSAVTYMLAALTLFFMDKKYYRLTFGNIILTGTAILLLLYLSYFIYVDGVLTRNWLPPDSTSYKTLSRCENPYNPLEYIESGRVEILIGIEAGLNNPLIGYGSWAPDRTGYYSNKLSLLKEIPYYSFSIPSHSALIGGWNWGGALGLTAWIGIIYLVIKYSCQLFAQRNPYLIYLCVMFYDTLWALFFSPVVQTRLYLSYVMAFLIVQIISASKIKPVISQIKIENVKNATK